MERAAVAQPEKEHSSCMPCMGASSWASAEKEVPAQPTTQPHPSAHMEEDSEAKNAYCFRKEVIPFL